MDVSNRMSDVVTLRTHALQDFLRLILCEDWRNYVYKRAKTEVESHGQYSNSYIAAYEKMRDVGIENYDVKDMDVSFICVIINYCGAIAKTQYKTQKTLEKLTEDRNVTGHSSGNEDDEELYLRGLLDLCNLRSFIKTVDKVETNIDNEVRLNYRQKYIAKIKQLMDLLDEERIELVQRRKTIEEEIQSILDSDDPFKTWYKIFEAYMYSIRNLDSKREELNAFLIAASDAGITYAHDRAADLFIVKGDYPEAVRRLRLLFEKHGKDKVPKDIAHTITNALYCITLRSNYSSEDIDEMIKCFKAQGYPIELTDEGVYYWDSKKKR